MSDLPRTGDGFSPGRRPHEVVTRLKNGTRTIVQANTPRETETAPHPMFGHVERKALGGMAREEHAGIVVAANTAIAELQELLALATERADVALGLIDAAVGQTSVESGRNAMAYVAGTKEKIEEAYRSTVIAQDELRRYAEGF